MNRTVELGSHAMVWTIFCFRYQQLVLWTLDAFVILFPTTVERARREVRKLPTDDPRNERARCEVHKLLCTGEVHATLISIGLAVAFGLSCL